MSAFDCDSPKILHRIAAGKEDSIRGPVLLREPTIASKGVPMASFEEHCRDCERLLGDRCESVNRWLDAKFREYREQHRFARHHWRGVKEAEALFGDLGRKAALVHILKDCGFVPRDRDWKEGKVDNLGMDRTRVFNGYWDPVAFVTAAQQLLAVDTASATSVDEKA